jgi:peptidoglycan/LPS O-acetylase OafA/YrhL
MIRSIQAYRGFAALLVVTFHANLMANEYFTSTPVTEFFRFGHSGVPFFFVLSGFIIYFIHKNDIGKPDRASTYLKKRIIRIYPIYWLVTLPVVPVYFLVPEFGEIFHRDWGALIKSLLLIPQTHPPHLSVAWTLVHEMLFYLLFALLIMQKTLGRLVIGAWLLVTLIAAVVSNTGQIILAHPADFFFSTYNLLFGFGLFAGWLNARSPELVQRFGLIAFVTGNILFVATGVLENNWLGKQDLTIILFGVAAFLIVCAAGQARVEQVFANKKLLQLMGNASYSIYLTHFLTVSLLSKIIRRIDVLAALPPLVNWTLLVVIATAVGVVVYLLVEKPALAAARRMVIRPTS